MLSQLSLSSLIDYIQLSQGQCERKTEAPGASQSVCSNTSCGIVMWHLARKCFERVHDGGFIELWQEDFALVVFRSGEKLLWTHPHRKLKQSWWERLEDSPQYDAYVPDAGSRERVQRNFEKLPPWNFNPPSYVPEQQLWRDAKPLEREAADSRWYCFCSLSSLGTVHYKQKAYDISHRGRGGGPPNYYILALQLFLYHQTFQLSFL